MSEVFTVLELLAVLVEELYIDGVSETSCKKQVFDTITHNKNEI